MKNKSFKSFLIFMSGFTIGGIFGTLVTKRYFESQYEENDEYDEYKRTLRDFYYYDEQDDEDDGINSTDHQEESRINGRMSDEERAKIKQKLDRNWEGTTNYAAMYKKQDDAENESNDVDSEICCGNCINYNYETGECCKNPDESVEVNYQNESCDSFEEFQSISEEEEIFEKHQKNKNRPPKIISAETFSELNPSIETEVLYFYADDKILCDENEEPIEDPEHIIGDCLDKYNFRNNDERIIFVMNYATDTAYEIQKVDAMWTDTHELVYPGD